MANCRLTVHNCYECLQLTRPIDNDDASPVLTDAVAFSCSAWADFTAKVVVAIDPPVAARRFLDEYGEAGDGQGLRGIMDTSASGNGEFAESEVWLFSGETLALVAALVETRIAC